nr:pleckstrin homology domain-containing family H member 1-like [Parasteatoda tepidariorum]
MNLADFMSPVKLLKISRMIISVIIYNLFNTSIVYIFRLCFRQLLKAETDKERLLTAYQINEDVVSGKFPLSKDLALELAVLMSQIEYGDYNGDKVRCSTGPTTPQQQMQSILERFYPSRYRDKGDEK